METLLLSQEITTDSIYVGKPQNIVSNNIILDDYISEYTTTISANTALVIDTSKLSKFDEYNCEFVVNVNSEGEYVLNLQDCDIQQIQLYRGVSTLKFKHMSGFDKWLVSVIQLGNQMAQHVLPSSTYDFPYNSYGIALSTQTATTQGVEVFSWLATEKTVNSSNKTWTWNSNEVQLFSVFPSPFILSKFYIHVGTSTSVNYPTSVVVYGSNDYSRWTQIYSDTVSYSTAQEIKELTPTIQNPYRVYKFVLSATNANLIVLPISLLGYKCSNIGNTKFYRYPKISAASGDYTVSINTEDGITMVNSHDVYGVVNTDNTYMEYSRPSSDIPWKITYTLPSPVRFEGFLVKSYTSYQSFWCNGWFKWEGSNDGTNWTKLCELTEPFGSYYINSMWMFYMIHTQCTYSMFRITVYNAYDIGSSNLLCSGLFPIYTVPDEYRNFDTIVPVMNSNSQDGYTVSASSVTTGYAYYMYNADDSTYCQGDIADGQWITSIDMGESVTIKGLQLKSASDNYSKMPITFSVQGSSDNETWQLLQSYTLGGSFWNSNSQIQSFTIANTTAYRYYRIVVTAVQDAGTSVRIGGIGWSSESGQPPIHYWTYEYLVPLLSSNSQDGYVASANVESSGQITYYAWRAFDRTISDRSSWGAKSQPAWLQIELPEAKVANILKVSGAFSGEEPTSFTLYASNDGTSWTSLLSSGSLTWTHNATKTWDIDNTTAYKYYRLGDVVNTRDSWVDVAEFTLLYKEEFNS